jgi:hypothetical protein
MLLEFRGILAFDARLEGGIGFDEPCVLERKAQ